MSEPRPRIGVDLGGTKIEALALDGDGAERLRRRVPTPQAQGYEAVVEAVAALVRSVEADLGASAPVGVGTPGALSPATGRLKNSNTVCLNGRALDRDLSAALQREVRLANDADCFALSEAVDGAGQDHDTVFGVIVGTGTGGGLVVRRRLLRGPNALSGEWGHHPLPWPEQDERPGPACYCGKRGCVETWLSGPGLARDHARRAGLREAIGGAEIAQRAAAHDPLCAESLTRYADRFARALAVVVQTVDPDVVVLGGGVSKLPGLPERVSERLAAHVFGGEACTPIVRARHGDSSGVRGAAWLWP